MQVILVTGATGRLGSRIVRLLRRARLPVRALVRSGSYYYRLNDTGCGYFFGDLRNPSRRYSCHIRENDGVVCLHRLLG